MIFDTDTHKCWLCKEVFGCISLILIVEKGGLKLRPQWAWRCSETEMLLYSASYVEDRKEAGYFLMQVTRFCSALCWNRAKCSISVPLLNSWGKLVERERRRPTSASGQWEDNWISIIVTWGKDNEYSTHDGAAHPRVNEQISHPVESLQRKNPCTLPSPPAPSGTALLIS